MDLTGEQSRQITKFVEDWLVDDRLELETTFGVRGVVDSNTFLQIAQRLRTKGYQEIPQEDRLNIITPNNIRFTLQGLGILQDYCNDDTLDNKLFTAMFKDRAFPDSNVDIHEYNIRFKMRREEELSNDDPRIKDILKDWKSQRKAFRLIRRWSFEGKGVRMDLSMVRQTSNVPNKPEYQWSTTFLERNVLNEVPRYEVEVELLHHTPYTDTPQNALKTLISGVGEIQRAIQKNTLLIRNSVKKNVLEQYTSITHTDRFRGVGPVTLQVINITADIDEDIPNIRTSYNVTDKADGLRTMGIVTESGELFLIDQSMNVYRTGLQNPKCKKSIVDGEWVTLTKDGKAINHYLIFDIYYSVDAEPSYKLPFATFKDGALDVTEPSRFNLMNQWYTLWNDSPQVIAKGVTESNRLLISLKKFVFASPGEAIFRNGCSTVLDTSRIYYTDGLILTSNSEPLPEKPGVRFDSQFKWKPSKDNTVDFLINFEQDPLLINKDKITTTIDPEDGQTIQYKTMRLYVGGSKDHDDIDPRNAILSGEPIIRDKDREREARPSDVPKYRPVLFYPLDFPDTMANTCNVITTTNPETLEEYVVTHDSNEPITSKCIVEMRYDPSKEAGWRWIPSRIRHDKTERLLRALSSGKNIKYSGMMNDEGVANSVWNSIHDPVTETMIRTGNEEPSENEMKDLTPLIESDITKKYYERNAPKQNMALVKGLQDFHNKYIKNDILLSKTLRRFKGKNAKLLDLACGKAGDLYKWLFNQARFVVGVDIAGENITNPSDGAYRRYYEAVKKMGMGRVGKMAFIIGNSSRSLVDGAAGANQQESDMLRTIFGQVPPEGPVPPFIQKDFTGLLRNGADVAACMFAIHYFFENKTILDGFLKNLSNTVKQGGYFVGCCFDGNKVFNLLRGIKKGHSKTGVEADVPIWTITKDYDAEELTNDDNSIGLGIDVEFISIGSTHKEYLVPFELLQEKLGEIGFRLLNDSELREMNLQYSTNTFDISYAMAESEKPSKGKNRFTMSETVKEFSFLNRWFIFKRQADGVELDQIPESELAIQRFGTDITRYNQNYKKFAIVSSSTYSVLKPWQKQQVRSILLSWFPYTSIKTIVDATAHIGVDTIHLSDVFPMATVDAYEVVPETFEALRRNIITFNKQDQIIPHNEDITTWEPTNMVDFIFVDPPWGGVDYATSKSIDLFLQKEGNSQNDTKNINVMIDKWLNTQKVKNVVLKAPKNFNKTYLFAKYKDRIREQPVINRAKNVAYTLIQIQSPYLEPLIEVSDEKKDDSVVEKKLDKPKPISTFSDPTRTYEESQVFRFGPEVRQMDILKTKNPLTGEKDINAGRWLSLGAPFPIPDLDRKDADGQPILYPSIEHYLAAMKLAHTSNSPDLAITQMSTSGSIHQKYALERRQKQIKAGSETPKDYELLDKEIDEVKKKMTKPFINQFRVTFDENKWNRPLVPNDPLSFRDRVLMDALNYRWENDERFRKIVEAAREQKKYLLYSIGGRSSDSEFAGTRVMTDPQKGTIKGGNKVGIFIMQIAGFQ